jgi:TonB family protein
MIYAPNVRGSFLLVALLFSCVAFVPPASLHAQQAPNNAADANELGINLYKQGNDGEAIEALQRAVKQRKDDVIAWHYLGLSLARRGKPNDARKAHEKAAKLGEKLLDKLLGSGSNQDFGDNVLPYSSLLSQAADSAEKYLGLSSKPSKSKVEEWSDRRDLLRDFAQPSGEDSTGNPALKVYKPSEVTTKARILSRPEPQYTEEARKNQVRGAIVLRAILAFDGKIRALRVVSGLPNGLTSMAVKAARRIRFVPATIDNRSVSQYVQIEYYFNLY